MNENAKKWVEALRSGDYEQTTGWLKCETGYCCLGVACELYRRDMDAGWWTSADEFRVGDATHSAHLPTDVMNWLGLRSPAGEFCPTADASDCLVDRNDNGATFEQIADVIESEPDGLFA